MGEFHTFASKNAHDMEELKHREAHSHRPHHARGHSHAPSCHHGHHHGHSHAYHDVTGRKLLWTSLLNILFTIIEIVGGVVSNSLSLLSDALHNLADSSAIFIAYIAHRVSKRKPNQQKTFGYKRFEIIAAFFNSVVLIGICLYLFVEAYRRFVNPEPIRGLVMLLVAAAGLAANLVSVLILHGKKNDNLNVKAAYLHLMGDTLSSVAVIIGGLCIWLWQVYWLDPVITVFVGMYIVWHTWAVLTETTDILMQAVPPGLSLDEVRGRIEAMPAVRNVHHIHAWRLNDSQQHLEAHVALSEDMSVSEAELVRLAIVRMLYEEFRISHSTLQMEFRDCAQPDCTPLNQPE